MSREEADELRAAAAVIGRHSEALKLEVLQLATLVEQGKKDPERRQGRGRHLHACPECGTGTWCTSSRCWTTPPRGEVARGAAVREGGPEWCGTTHGLCGCRICHHELPSGKRCGIEAINPSAPKAALRCGRHR